MRSSRAWCSASTTSARVDRTAGARPGVSNCGWRSAWRMSSSAPCRAASAKARWSTGSPGSVAPTPATTGPAAFEAARAGRTTRTGQGAAGQAQGNRADPDTGRAELDVVATTVNRASYERETSDRTICPSPRSCRTGMLGNSWDRTRAQGTVTAWAADCAVAVAVATAGTGRSTTCSSRTPAARGSASRAARHTSGCSRVGRRCRPVGGWCPRRCRSPVVDPAFPGLCHRVPGRLGQALFTYPLTGEAGSSRSRSRISAASAVRPTLSSPLAKFASTTCSFSRKAPGSPAARRR